MTGVQTCALPICFPVTIRESPFRLTGSIKTGFFTRRYKDKAIVKCIQSDSHARHMSKCKYRHTTISDCDYCHGKRKLYMKPHRLLMPTSPKLTQPYQVCPPQVDLVTFGIQANSGQERSNSDRTGLALSSNMNQSPRDGADLTAYDDSVNSEAVVALKGCRPVMLPDV